MFTDQEEGDRINGQCLALFLHLVFFIMNCMSRTAGPEQQDVGHSLFFSHPSEDALHGLFYGSALTKYIITKLSDSV